MLILWKKDYENCGENVCVWGWFKMKVIGLICRLNMKYEFVDKVYWLLIFGDKLKYKNYFFKIV